MWSIRRLATVAPLLVVVGCGDGCSCSDSKGDRTAPKPVGLPGGARVEILERGAEPRIELQVGRWTGMRYRAVFRSRSSFGLAGKKPVTTPESVSTVLFRVTRGTADPVVRQKAGVELKYVQERARIESVRIESKDLPPAAVAGINAALAGFAGTATKQLVSEDGEVAEMRTELVGGEEPEPEVKKALDAAWDVQRRFPFRLPREPLGVGGKWKFSEPIDVAGVRAIQVSEMTVQKVGAETVRLGIKVRYQAPKQDIVHPFDPEGTATLDAFRGDGQGYMVIERLTALTREAELNTTASLTLSADAAEGRRTATYISASAMHVTARQVSDDAGIDGGDFPAAPDAGAWVSPEAGAADGAGGK